MSHLTAAGSTRTEGRQKSNVQNALWTAHYIACAMADAARLYEEVPR